MAMLQAILPIERLETLRNDLARFAEETELNRFQRYIVQEMYTLRVPDDLPFTPRSIAIAVVPGYARRDVTFTLDNRAYTFPTPAWEIDPAHTRKGVTALLQAQGMQVAFAPQLPRKRLAVCAGISLYGRCNITFAPGMGSFNNIYTFFTDRTPESDPWRPIAALERCANCAICQRACPTGAILPDRFLIDNLRCLTAVNENREPAQFPEWIPDSAHNAVVQCLRCQNVCPENRPYLDRIGLPAAFDAAETALLLDGAAYDAMPDAMRAKVDNLGLKGYLPALPRNIRALVAQAKNV